MLSNSFFRIIKQFSFIKQKKIYKFIKQIIFPFLITNFSKVYKSKINEKLIVMGAFSGGGFVDNTKYLFKFLSERSNYTVFWMTKMDQIIDDLSKNGYNVVRTYSLKSIKLLRRAKYIFMTHGLEDILPIKFSAKTIKILTWHGTPLKNIDVDQENDYRYNGWGDRFHLNLKHNDYTNYFLTASKLMEDQIIFHKALKISKNKLLNFGYPKNDILHDPEDSLIFSLKKKYALSENIKQVILYAPTWRHRTNSEFPISSTILKKINQYLKESNSIILIKAHIIDEKLLTQEYEYIKVVDKSSDIQELAIISDLLITDYSSIYFDYLLTLKPIIFFPNDLEEYESKKGFYYSYQDIVPGPIVFNGEDLLKTLKDREKIDEHYRGIRIKMRDRFNKYQDGKSTQRLLDFLNINYS